MAPLAELIHEKTSGNPFFAIQFIVTLADEDLLTFDYTTAGWSWDLRQIYGKNYTDNVVDLMVGRLGRLPPQTQKALQQFASLGNRAEFDLLRMVYNESEDQLHRHLWEAVRAGLIFRAESTYRFLHDRVQEAAYSLIPVELRSQEHLRIGTILSEHIPPQRREEAIFEIVNQLNHGVELLASPSQRVWLAKFNLTAGIRAKTSTAYGSALKYLEIGASLLSEDDWSLHHELMFQLELHRAECEFLVGQIPLAADHLSSLATRTSNWDEKAKVACLRSDVYTTQNRSDLAISVCLDCLRDQGIAWPAQPSFEDVRREYDRIWDHLVEREIGDLIQTAPMTDRRSLAMLEVLTKALPAAMFTDENLHSALICSAVNLSLRYGNGDGSCSAYVWLGVIARHRFNDFQAGFQFGQLGYQLVRQWDLKRFEAQVLLIFGQMIKPWAQHIQTCEELMRRGFAAASRRGELTYAGYCCNSLITNLLATGAPGRGAARGGGWA